MKITYTKPRNTVKFSDIAIGQTFMVNKAVYVRIESGHNTDNVFCFTNYKTHNFNPQFGVELIVNPVDVELIVHAEEQ